jgi:hypothetical protein
MLNRKIYQTKKKERNTIKTSQQRYRRYGPVNLTGVEIRAPVKGFA